MNFRYRPEIDGLRALAVISVILFHADIPLFKGGFVGVDIFFVISGYLITSIILKDIDKKDFKIKKFYERRARRILPALIVVVILSSIFSLIFFNSEDLFFFFKSAISSLTFWSNLQFHNEADYFAKSSEFKPLLHTWSLSIEEQFYIVFPLFVILILSFNKNYLLISIIFIFFLSLLFAQWSGNLSKNFPFLDRNLNFLSRSEFALFFMPFGRMWEIALGCICALLLKNNFIKKKQSSNLMSLIGLALIIFSIFYLSENFPFPSFYTLIPTIGTAFIILFTFGDNIVLKIFSTKILVFFGLISYSLYLFHFPIFTFVKHNNVETSLSIFSILIFLTFLLSYFNWRFIEKPFRSNKIRLKNFIYLIFGAYLIVLSVSLYSINFKIPTKTYIDDLPLQIKKSLSPKTNNSECLNKIKIHEDFTQKELCYLGDKNQIKTNFVIFGDSHTLSFYKLLNDHFRVLNQKALLVGYPGCPPLLGVYSIRGDQKDKNCKELNDKVFKFVKKNNIKNILFISRWSYYTGEEVPNGVFNAINKSLDYNTNIKTSKMIFKRSVEKTFKDYSAINLNIFIMEQAPFHYFSPTQVYLRSYNKNKKQFIDKLNSFSIQKKEFIKNQNFSRSILVSNSSKYENINFIKISDIFCSNSNKICKIGDESKSFYRDKNHLNYHGAELLKKRIIENINQ